MNTLIYYSFNILGLSILVLIIGMIKPKWIFLWMDKPGRMPVAFIAAVLFMIGAIMFGEGNKQMQQEKALQTKPQAVQPSAEVPVPVPSALPAAPGK